MKKLGTVPIPEIRYQREGNRAQHAREMINGLVPGKADLYEFTDKKEAQDLRSMISTMAILKFGEAGRISTRVIENTMYIWLRDIERKED